MGGSFGPPRWVAAKLCPPASTAIAMEGQPRIRPGGDAWRARISTWGDATALGRVYARVDVVACALMAARPRLPRRRDRRGAGGTGRGGRAHGDTRRRLRTACRLD